MKKSIEFKLRTSSAHQRLLLKLLDKGKSIYNLGLSECKKRLNRLRADKEYQTILSLRRDLKKAKLPTKQVDQLLRDIVTKRYFLTKTGIEKYVKDNAGYLRDGFNSQFEQTLADRAFDTIQKVLYGKSKKVRFKGKWDNILASVNSTHVRLSDCIVKYINKFFGGRSIKYFPPKNLFWAQMNLFREDKNFYSPVFGSTFWIIFAPLCLVWRYRS